jgi:hypothetical protein
LIVIHEYRQKHGMPEPISSRNLRKSNRTVPHADRPWPSGSSAADQAECISEGQTPPSEKKETRAGGSAAGDALEMLDAFSSVGAQRFDLTFTDIAGRKIAFRGNRSLGELGPALAGILQAAEERQHNVIVRPRSLTAALIQLDDLDEKAAGRVRPVSFLTLRTSPGNYQAWVAVAEADTDFARRLRKGVGADPTASGATRVSGSLNFKSKYSPAFPRVETVQASPGRVVSRGELEALGIVAPPEPQALAASRIQRRPGARGWPSYQRCVDNAPPAHEGGRPDISRADFTFCLLALDWGWGVEETAARLMQESVKAREKGEAYAIRTARSAAAALEQRGGRQRLWSCDQRPRAPGGNCFRR